MIFLMIYFSNDFLMIYCIKCFIGDKYGNEMLPMEFTVDEYNAIRTAALESGIPADGKFFAKNI